MRQTQDTVQPRSVIAMIRAFLADRTDFAADVGEQEDLFQSGALDSLGIVDLIALLEERFEVKIPVSDVTVENFATLGAIGQYVSDSAATDRAT